MEEKPVKEMEKPYPKNRKYFYKVMQHLKIEGGVARYEPTLVKFAEPDEIEVHGPPLPIKKRRMNVMCPENENSETVVTDKPTVVATEGEADKTVPKP